MFSIILQSLYYTYDCITIIYNMHIYLQKKPFAPSSFVSIVTCIMRVMNESFKVREMSSNK